MRVMLVRAAVVLLLCACGGPSTRGPAAKNAPLAWAPADSPFVFAALEPVPFEVVDLYAQLLQPMFEVLRDPFSVRSSDPGRDFAQLLHVLQAEWKREGIEPLGLSPSPRFAAFMIDGVPVVRLEVASGAVVRRQIRDVAERTNTKLPARETKAGREFWRLVSGSHNRIIAVHDDQLILAWGNRAEIDRALPRILGAERPSRPMPLDELTAARTRHGLGPIVGVLDTKRALDALIYDARLTPIPRCTGAIAAIAARIPRAVASYTVAGKHQRLEVIVETAPEITAALRAAQVAFPAMTAELAERRFLTLGLAFDLARMQEIAAGGLDALARLGTACEWSEVNDLVHELAIVRTPLPGPVATIHGALVSLRTLSLELGGYIPMPERMVGFGLLAARDPKLLFVLLQTQQLVSRLGILPDGELRKIAPERLPFPVPYALHGGVTDAHIVVAADDKGKELAERALAQKGDVLAPLAAGGYDWARVLELLNTLTVMDRRGDRDRDGARVEGASRVARGGFTVEPRAGGLAIALDTELK